jgi:hypothetical protein
MGHLGCAADNGQRPAAHCQRLEGHPSQPVRHCVVAHQLRLTAMAQQSRLIAMGRIGSSDKKGD